MFGWFGRKSAPETITCAYGPPPWLAGACDEGFVRGFEWLTALDKASGELATYTSGAWDMGHVRAAKVSVGGNQVIGARLAAVADPTGGTTIDAEARTSIAAILARLRQHGLITP